jgi:dipeptidase
LLQKVQLTDGSTFVTHSDDDDLSDQSIIYVPAKDWPKSAKRPVHGTAVANGDLPRFKDFFEPRLVDPSRSPDYANPKYPKSILEVIFLRCRAVHI